MPLHATKRIENRGLSATTQLSTHELVRGLGPIAAISINVGNIIGTGIFLKARVMTCNVGTPWRVILAWIAAGLLALAGALTYAELTTMRPHAGAEYVITKDAYGRVWGFLNGWSQFLISRTASAAALAVGFAIFMNNLLDNRLKVVWLTFTMPGFGHEVQLGTLTVIALITIAVTTLINCAAVSVSGHVASLDHDSKGLARAWSWRRGVLLSGRRLGQFLDGEHGIMRR